MLILGGGFFAIGATRALRDRIRSGELDVTVIDRENYQFFHGFVAEFIAGRMGPTHPLNPIRRMFTPARIAVGEIEAIDLVDRRVAITRELDGLRVELPYDHLMIGLGSVDNLGMYPGLAEHAFKLKTYDDAFRLRNHILKMFEMADIEDDPTERRHLLTFFVAGGGYAGTEVASELADLCRRLAGREYLNVRQEDWRVVLVHPGPTILPELYGSGTAGDAHGHPRLVDYATRHVNGLGVELLTNTFVVSASPNEVGLSNGELVRTHTIVSAVGTVGPPLFGSLDLPKDAKGRLVTDQFMRVGGTDIWAGGDCAAVPHPDGGLCPPQALYALHAGRTAGGNLARSLEGETMRPLTYRALGQGVSIGRGSAVAELKGIELKGRLAWVILRLFLLRYTPSWDRRLRILADWAITPLVGRDIVESSIADADDYQLKHHTYQPGQLIVREGRAGRQVHVIMSGEVELIRTGDDGTEHVLAALGPGQHFGQEWQDQPPNETARARTAVETITLRTDQTRDLRRLISALEGVLTEQAKED